ncbi:hypothetical protein C8A05DRAFT_11451 [Staphylotrichum tortipilum]|uniref:Uncharacterized protein n=1 Tax=Staphylotrichum tortipilum TaxID=2831512 RepID=A0AAN6RYI2_9PEZI|nr:hypothetical protein C8A05DRAFT_11451 [Staphylotrichum longicolle]
METAKPKPPPTLEELANDPSRTHRTWYPKYGRVQKCDYCNGRSEGTLHVCSDCSVRICVHCARSRAWAVQRSRHFIDVDACDWAVKKPPRPIKPATQRGSKRPAQSPPENAPSGPAARRRKLGNSLSGADDGNDDEDDSGDDDSHIPNSRGRSTLRLAPVVGRNGGDNGQSRARPSAIQSRDASHEVGTPDVISQVTPPPFTAEDEERDNLIKDIYYWIYGTRPTLGPHRMRTPIPDIWEGDRLPGSYNTRPGYDQGGSSQGGNPYHPTSRTTPSYHPHSNHTPAEVEQLQHDRQTLAEMQDAWIHHPELARMAGNWIGISIKNGEKAGETRRVYAIELLWDVLEARRSRVLLRGDSQTVRWFVSERDRQFRLEHSAREGRSAK